MCLVLCNRRRSGIFCIQFTAIKLPYWMIVLRGMHHLTPALNILLMLLKREEVAADFSQVIRPKSFWKRFDADGLL